jgi:hypothetical protein
MNYRLLGRAQAALVCGVMMYAGPAMSQVTAEQLQVIQVRAYVDGTIHVWFDKEISPACGDRLRVPPGEGRESVRALALSAMLAEKIVSVSSHDVPSGNFCNLIYLRVH